MKKFNKIMSVLVVAVAVFAFVAPVFGVNFNKGDVDGVLNSGTANTDVEKVVGNVWGTVTLVIQILAVACVVFAGLRYMFASADAKADIKKQTTILVIGAVLVFGATWIVQLISNVTTGSLGTITTP